MARHILLFLSAFFLLLSSPHAQSSRGTSFWLGYMENIDLVFNDSPIFSILIDAEESTQGTIGVPATGLSIPFTAAAGTVTEVELPDAIWYSQGSEIIDNKGILITTDRPVRASAFHYRAYFSESTHLLPESELGTEYIASCYLDDRRNYPTALVVVSAEEEHTIEITPSTLTQGLRPAGVPFTITLQRGQNFQIKAEGDLTGTHIRSLGHKKLAVFSGAQRAFIGNCFGGADSHAFEQALPIEQWGTLYHYIPFRLLATEAGGCVYDRQVSIHILVCEAVECPPADIIEIVPPEAGLCADTLLAFRAELPGVPSAAYAWELGNGETADSVLAVTAYDPGAYTITVEAEDSLGCRYNDSFSFEIERCLENCPLSFPNAFTPNGDGTNDRFGPLFQCPPREYALQVFNRWGELVFESQNPEENWDGTYEGKAVPADIFFWQAAYTLDNGEGRRASGDVSLLR